MRSDHTAGRLATAPAQAMADTHWLPVLMVTEAVDAKQAQVASSPLVVTQTLLAPVATTCTVAPSGTRPRSCSGADWYCRAGVDRRVTACAAEGPLPPGQAHPRPRSCIGWGGWDGRGAASVSWGNAPTPRHSPAVAPQLGSAGSLPSVVWARHSQSASGAAAVRGAPSGRIPPVGVKVTGPAGGSTARERLRISPASPTLEQPRALRCTSVWSPVGSGAGEQPHAGSDGGAAGVPIVQQTTMAPALTAYMDPPSATCDPDGSRATGPTAEAAAKVAADTPAACRAGGVG
mmetsp:Transcript_99073/g.170613  ORF Transcript_99073/g.170613 Transcript_99073/m.170613 type:complete len:290 (-) Transcript_99073:585-1454(-)